MTPPRNAHAPAWTYLFHADVAFEASTPREDRLVQGARRDGGRRVIVRAGPARDALVASRDLWGAALFAPRDLSERDLARLGFAYVRRFALFPRATRARWFVPLGDANLSAAALRALATPYRPQGRALAALASLALRTAGPLLRGSELWIASREMPPVELELARILGRAPAAVGLASGGWGLRHTPTVVALDVHGVPLAFAKLAGSERSRRLVMHEARVLEALASRDGLRDAVPRLLYAGLIDGTFANVQTPLAGKPGPAHLSAEHERFLSALSDGERRDATASELVGTLRRRALEHGGEFVPLLTRAIEALADARLPRTVVHGDFAPFNLRLRDRRLQAFDWENACLDGLPLIDLIHHECQVGFLLRGWDVRAARRALDRIAAERARDGLSPVRVRALQAVYLLDMYLRRLDGGHGEDSPLTRKYVHLLRHVAPKLGAVA